MLASWKDYVDRVSEIYPEYDKKVINKIIFYGLYRIYRMLSFSHYFFPIDMPFNHWLIFGYPTRRDFEKWRLQHKRWYENFKMRKRDKMLGRREQKRLEKIKRYEQDLFEGRISNIKYPSCLKVEPFVGYYYICARYRDIYDISPIKENVLRRVLITTSLDFAKSRSKYILKIWRDKNVGAMKLVGEIRFYEYQIIVAEDGFNLNYITIKQLSDSELEDL